MHVKEQPIICCHLNNETRNLLILAANQKLETLIYSNLLPRLILFSPVGVLLIKVSRVHQMVWSASQGS